jgi:Beta-lactamase
MKFQKSKLAGLLSIALVASFGVQAEETDEQVMSFAAGYKASFTCSGVFNAGATIEQLAAHELRGINPVLSAAFAQLPGAIIDRENHTVSVTYSEGQPPRIAAWRPYLGCAQLPMGAGANDRLSLPGVSLGARDRSGADAHWPQGDILGAQASDNEALRAVVEAAFDMETYGEGAETSAVIITTPDRLIAERYLEGFGLRRPQRTWSVAKSIAVTVIGIAINDGILDLNAPAPVPEWQSAGDPRHKITLENLLNMASGLYSGRAGNYTPFVYYGGSRVSDITTGQPLEVEPASRWKYANNDTMLSIRALRGALGDDQAYQNYPFAELINKIGMRDTYLETDWEGNYILSSQVWTTARDLARLGILYLNRGVWNGQRLFADEWADYVSTPAVVEPEGGDWGYGAQFWLYNRDALKLPADTFAARGNRGQTIMIMPSRNLVIVRRGYDTATGNRFDIARFTLDILNALDSE